MAVLAPIPSANVSTATVAKPGDLRSVRAAKRKSCSNVSTTGTPRRSRYLAAVCVTPPSFISASLRASCGFIPRRKLSSMCIRTWLSSSSAISWLLSRLRKSSANRRSKARNHLIDFPFAELRSGTGSLEALSSGPSHNAARPSGRRAWRGARGCRLPISQPRVWPLGQ